MKCIGKTEYVPNRTNKACDVLHFIKQKVKAHKQKNCYQVIGHKGIVNDRIVPDKESEDPIDNRYCHESDSADLERLLVYFSYIFFVL
ncbi:MAG: hypothetical protein IJM28_05060 [Lachnospiraceae bacterium]|nr:hypothetical protein [Lachnospiraceae bacterium]